MKTYIKMILALTIPFMMGCGQEEVKKDNTLPENVTTPIAGDKAGSVDLSGHGVNLVIDIPTDVKDKLVFDNTMDLRIEVGNEYAFTITGHEIEPEDEVMKDIINDRIKERKTEIKENTSVPFTRFVTDEPLLCMWESAKEFQCYGIVVSGNTWYEIETAVMQNETYFSESVQKKLLEVIKSAKPSVK